MPLRLAALDVYVYYILVMISHAVDMAGAAAAYAHQSARRGSRISHCERRVAEDLFIS